MPTQEEDTSVVKLLFHFQWRLISWFLSMPRQARNSGRARPKCEGEEEKGLQFGAEMLLQKYTNLICNEVICCGEVYFTTLGIVITKIISSNIYT